MFAAICNYWRLSLAIAWGAVATANGAEQTKARLLMSAESARPDDTLVAAVELTMPSGWHTYWRNSGESGIPTQIDWHLPAGLTAGETLWPIPEKFSSGGLITYGYSGKVLLLVPISISQDMPRGSTELRANVSWLQCKDLCLPGRATVRAKVSIGSQTILSTHAALLETWQKRLPQTTNRLNARVQFESQPAADTVPIRIEWISADRLVDADFFPYSSDDFEISGTTKNAKTSAATVVLRTSLRKNIGKPWPKAIEGVIVTRSVKQANPEAFEVRLPIDGSRHAFE